MIALDLVDQLVLNKIKHLDVLDAKNIAVGVEECSEEKMGDNCIFEQGHRGDAELLVKGSGFGVLLQQKVLVDPVQHGEVKAANWI